jgi:hypothetical protein
VDQPARDVIDEIRNVDIKLLANWVRGCFFELLHLLSTEQHPLLYPFTPEGQHVPNLFFTSMASPAVVAAIGGVPDVAELLNQIGTKERIFFYDKPEQLLDTALEYASFKQAGMGPDQAYEEVSHMAPSSDFTWNMNTPKDMHVGPPATEEEMHPVG